MSQNDNINNYVSQQSHQKTSIQSVNHYIEQVKSNIISGIQQGQILINQNSQEIKFNKRNTISEEEAKIKIKNLLQNKEKMMTSLNDLYEQQSKIRKLLNQQLRSKKRNPQKSQMTTEEKQKIKQLLKIRRQFQDKMKNKIQNVIQKAQEDENQRQRKRYLLKIEKINKRKQEIKKHHSLYQNSINKVQNLIKSINTKQKNYLYQENQIKDSSLSEQKKRYETLVLNQKRKKMTTNYEEIAEHAVKHADFINKKKLQSQQHSLQKSRKKTKKYEQSLFMKNIMKQQMERKIQQQAKKRQKLDFYGRIKDYKYYVKSNFQPHISEESKFIPKTQNPSLNSFSYQQRLQIGNKYLDHAKRMKKEIHQSKINTQITQNDESTRVIYKNYLKDIKLKTKTTSDSQGQLQSLLKKDKLTKKQAETAISLSKKVQKSQKKQSKQFELKVATNKLKLLQILIKSQHI